MKYNTLRRSFCTFTLSILATLLLVLAGVATPVLAQSGVPDRPNGLTVSSFTHNSITLTWDDPGDSGITGYQVLRRSRDDEQYGDGKGASTFVAVVGDTGSSATTYTDTSVTAHSRYVYRVKARNSEGLGPRSSYVNVETSTAPSAPDAPTGLTVSSFTHNSVTLAWDDSGDSGITGYQVLRRDLVKQEPGIFSTAAADTGTAATTYTDTDVAANTRYAYRVEAINAEGNSGRSNYVNVKTSAALSVVNSVSVKSLPAKPSGLELSSALDNAVTFEWDDPGDSSITHYKVLRRVGDSGKFSTIEENTGSADTSYTDTTVSAETTYEYRVVAVNGDGDSPESDSLSVETSAEPRIIFVEIPVDDPIAEEQSVESQGSITIDSPLWTKGEIEIAAERHRYEVALEANKFYKFNICGCHGDESGFDKRQLRLLDSAGDPVQDNGEDIISTPHRLFSGTYIYYMPTSDGTYQLEVRASDDQQTGTYVLYANDVTIYATTDEQSGGANDFNLFRRGTLVLFGGNDDILDGKLNTDGDEGGTVRDVDYFSANLHAGQTYKFEFRMTSGGIYSASIQGPRPENTDQDRGRTLFFPYHGETRSLDALFTPERTGQFVIDLFHPANYNSDYTITMRLDSD